MNSISNAALAAQYRPAYLPTGFGRILTQLRTAYTLRATRNALRQLSDRELDDIGLNRADIDMFGTSAARR